MVGTRIRPESSTIGLLLYADGVSSGVYIRAMGVGLQNEQKKKISFQSCVATIALRNEQSKKEKTGNFGVVVWGARINTLIRLLKRL